LTNSDGGPEIGSGREIDSVDLLATVKSDLTLKNYANATGISSGNAEASGQSLVHALTISQSTLTVDNFGNGPGIGRGTAQVSAQSVVHDIAIGDSVLNVNTDGTGSGIGTMGGYDWGNSEIGNLRIRNSIVNATNVSHSLIGCPDALGATSRIKEVTIANSTIFARSVSGDPLIGMRGTSSGTEIGSLLLSGDVLMEYNTAGLGQAISVSSALINSESRLWIVTDTLPIFERPPSSAGIFDLLILSGAKSRTSHFSIIGAIHANCSFGSPDQ
jgi:hypothetical protein